MGFRMVRDAGGLETIGLDKTAEKLEPTISILPCCGMVSAENAENEKF
ncbi:MAG: hypothetical protein ACLRZ6_10305 [Lachnospiraceae bacterium]